jgi:hypothetical protein
VIALSTSKEDFRIPLSASHSAGHPIQDAPPRAPSSVVSDTAVEPRLARRAARSAAKEQMS